jgi:hypothetical protein
MGVGELFQLLGGEFFELWRVSGFGIVKWEKVALILAIFEVKGFKDFVEFIVV